MNRNTHHDTHDNAHGIDPLEWQAYLDDEADAGTRARIDAAIAADPALAARLACDRRLQIRVRDAFSDALDEPLPAHLLGMLAAEPAPQTAPASHSQGASNVLTLPQRNTHRRLPPAWFGYAVAAALAVVAVGGAWRQMQSPVRLGDGGLVAGGVLADELDRALASAPNAGSRVSIGLTFRTHEGRICRSFTYREETAMSGLACRHDGAWYVSTLVHTASANESDWRQAASVTTPAVQAAIDAAIVGDAFDAEAERGARDRGWR